MICDTYPKVVDKLIVIAWGVASFLFGYFVNSIKSETNSVGDTEKEVNKI